MCVCVCARVSRKWHYNCNDPHLYQDIEFKNLEFNTLIYAMKYVLKISPLIRSIRIDGCYSEFTRNTVIPVQFSSSPSQNRQPMLLYSHIRALQSSRRRQEYIKHGFELHNLFSDIFTQLLQLSHSTLIALQITHCDLDFEMTELFCSIACHGQSLESFYYMNNGDKGLHSSGLLQAIVSGCPQMRHFLGLHAGMNDTVLITMARHWPNLESLTLCSIKSKDVLEFSGFISGGGHEFRGASPTGSISNHAFWELLDKCKKLTTLEVHDLACFTNRDLSLYLSLRKQQQNLKSHKFHPYQKRKQRMTGDSLVNLKVTKYITTPLSTPGFHDLVQLFPNLKHFEYATNYDTFNNQFQGITPEMFEAERTAVAHFFFQQGNSCIYDGHWNEPITTEQRLMAGMATRP